MYYQEFNILNIKGPRIRFRNDSLRHALFFTVGAVAEWWLVCCTFPRDARPFETKNRNLRIRAEVATVLEVVLRLVLGSHCCIGNSGIPVHIVALHSFISLFLDFQMTSVHRVLVQCPTRGSLHTIALSKPYLHPICTDTRVRFHVLPAALLSDPSPRLKRTVGRQMLLMSSRCCILEAWG